MTERSFALIVKKYLVKYLGCHDVKILFRRDKDCYVLTFLSNGIPFGQMLIQSLKQFRFVQIIGRENKCSIITPIDVKLESSISSGSVGVFCADLKLDIIDFINYSKMMNSFGNATTNKWVDNIVVREMRYD
jgi:hypothetical protein